MDGTGMTGELRFSDPFRINEWNELVLWLKDHFEKEELRKVVYFLKDDNSMEVDDENKGPENNVSMEVDDENNEKTWDTFFYHTVDGGKDKLQAALKLQEAIEYLQLHHGLGENVTEKIQTFIDRLRKYQKGFEVETKQLLFIGRETELEILMDLINHNDVNIEKDNVNVFAVSICGIGGQGKSLLARQVCLKLGQADGVSSWSVVKADLRNKRSTIDVIKSLLAAADGNFPIYGEQEQLQNVLIQAIHRGNSDILFCLDDCDHVLKNESEQFIKFLEAIILEAGRHEKKIRLLLTTREKLPRNGTKMDKYTLKLSQTLAEVELCELEQADAVELLKACSKNQEIESKIAEAIVKDCACSPLAVSVVAELIKNRKFTPERLAFHLTIDKKNVTKALKVDKCIAEAMNNLDKEQQNALVSLSVFQSTSFDLKAASKIIGIQNKNILQGLYNCHLLEVEEHPRRSKDPEKPDITYSLHPLVYRFISEWKKPEDLKSAYQSFVSYYERFINTVVKLLESKYWKGQQKLEKHKVHILKFYEIMSEQPQLLKKHQKETHDNGVLSKKRISDLADILLCLVQNRRMFQSEADRALKSGNKAMYIFWMVEKADVFLMLHDKVDIALEILNELADKYPGTSLRDLGKEPYHLALVQGMFHKVKGLCRWKQRSYESSLNHLQLAINFFSMLCCQYRSGKGDVKTPYDIFVARVKCYIGQVFIDSGDYGKADQFLTEGQQLVRRSMIDNSKDGDNSKEGEVDELTQDLHWDIPRYYTHFARIKLLKAKTTDDKKTREVLLDKALEDLERGIKLDEQLKLDYLDGYLAKFKLKADVNIEKGLLMEALRDAKDVLDKRREILQPPHTHYTESVYQVGRIYMLLGNDYDNKGEKESAKSHWNRSSVYFKELKDCRLKDGGISIDNPVFQDIKRDHIQVMMLTGTNRNVRQIQRFYNDVETGAYDPEKKSSIKSMKNMMWTPFEMLKKYLGGGGKEFGANDDKITQMENLARDQQARMIRGEPSGGARRDSGIGHSSSDLGDSFSSESGSMSAHMERMHLEKSLSLEDDVFQNSGEHETVDDKRKRLSKKRQKTIDEDREL